MALSAVCQSPPMSQRKLPINDPLKNHTDLSILGVVVFVIAVIVTVGLALYSPIA